MLLGVDVGGTFTDAVLLTGTEVVTAKAPSTPEDQSRGVLDAVDAVLRRARARHSGVERFVHGMTVGTNALLEGRTARTALLATEGFTDLEELGRQTRRDLYRLCADNPPPLVPPELRVAVPERTSAGGVVRALDEDLLRERLGATEEAPEAVAVCLLWGFRHPEHERLSAEIAERELPGVHVSTSHETAGVFREFERCATTVVDAALSPLLRGYLERLTERARGAGLPEPEVMLSGGGVASAATAARHASWTVLSGPAGGAVGAARLARRAGAGDGAVCLDMGGTSCDISLAIDGRVATTGVGEVSGRPLALPMVDVHTIGAGGGSVAWRDTGGALRVGPRSAGAVPGPACYGRGGSEPTVTDANLALGYLAESSPLAGGVRLDRLAAERALGELGSGLGLTAVETAAGIVRIASFEMAQAVRVATVERGIDPRSMALLAFGGAGPLHAAAIADELGMTRVLVPHTSGVLSALGLVISERRRDLVDSPLLSGAELRRESIAAVVERLAERGRADLGDGGAQVRASYDIRYAGQAFELTIPGDSHPDPAELRRAFEAEHAERYGYADPEASIELVTVRVAVALPGGDLADASAEAPWTARGEREVILDGRPVEAAVFRGIPPAVEGPAICELDEATVVVPTGWAGGAGAEGTLILERSTW